MAQEDAPTDRRPDARPEDARKRDHRHPRRERPADPIGKALDSDGNQIISAAELANAPVALLTLDKDKDGKLSKAECGHKRREQGKREGGGNRLLMLDKDKDGKISKAEGGEKLGKRFAAMDKNSDGFIDKHEMKAMRDSRKGQGDRKPKGNPEDGVRPQGDKPKGDGTGKRQGHGQGTGEGQRGRGGEMRRRGGGSAFMRALDTDHNGELSAAEITASTASLTKLDKNKDGQLTKEEIMPARGRRGDSGSGGDRMGGFFKRMDQDGDGKISRDEAPGRMADRFDDLDADGDGFITQDEMKEAMERRRRGR